MISLIFIFPATEKANGKQRPDPRVAISGNYYACYYKLMTRNCMHYAEATPTRGLAPSSRCYTAQILAIDLASTCHRNQRGGIRAQNADRGIVQPIYTVVQPYSGEPLSSRMRTAAALRFDQRRIPNLQAVQKLRQLHLYITESERSDDTHTGLTAD